MKNLLIIFACMLNFIYTTAQDNNFKVEAEIRVLEEKEHKAMLNQDAKTLEQVWAPEFMVNAPFNRVTLGSKEVIDLVKKGVIKYSSFTRNIEQFMVQGDVVITMGSEEVVPVGDVPNAGKTVKRRYTNIWMKQNGIWRLSARHANVISPQ